MYLMHRHKKNTFLKQLKSRNSSFCRSCNVKLSVCVLSTATDNHHLLLLLFLCHFTFSFTISLPSANSSRWTAHFLLLLLLHLLPLLLLLILSSIFGGCSGSTCYHQKHLILKYKKCVFAHTVFSLTSADSRRSFTGL